MLRGSKVAHYIPWPRTQEGSSQRAGVPGAALLLGRDLGAWAAGRAGHVSERQPSPPRPAWVTPGVTLQGLNASPSAYFCVSNQVTWPTSTSASFSVGWTYQNLPPVLAVGLNGGECFKTSGTELGIKSQMD